LRFLSLSLSLALSLMHSLALSLTHSLALSLAIAVQRDLIAIDFLSARPDPTWQRSICIRSAARSSARHFKPPSGASSP
jgi:hypothetical protein